jgi:hypothetical protein
MTRQLNSTIYNKLVLQAQEAKEQNLTKLADAMSEVLAADPNDQRFLYSYSELEEDIYGQLWKAAANVFIYHDLDAVQIEKLDPIIKSIASKLLSQ